MTIPLLDLKKQYHSIKEELEAAIRPTLDSQMLIGGNEVESFEDEICDYLKVEHAIGCGNGTEAILLALTCMDIKPGDEIITTPFTFFGTVSPIVRLGAKPVFADIEPDSLHIDVSKLESLLTEKTKAIVPVHLYGGSCRIDAIVEVANQHNLIVLEDSAQAIGTTYKGRYAGTFGAAGTLSFYPTKNLGALGDAGMVVTNDESLAERIRFYRSHAERTKYRHFEFAINSRLDALQAAALRVKLRHLEEWIDARRKCAVIYYQLFENSGLLDSRISIPSIEEEDGSRHTYYLYTIQCERRDELQEFLKSKNIGTGIHYPDLIYNQPAYKELYSDQPFCPEAENAVNRVLSIPLFPGLTEQEQVTVVEAIKEFYDEYPD